MPQINSNNPQAYNWEITVNVKSSSKITTAKSTTHELQKINENETKTEC